MRSSDLTDLNLESIFSEIYSANLWKGKESKSGPSSNLPRTENLRLQLPGILNDTNSKTMLDLPCGDFYWMKEVVQALNVRYLGADIVPSVIHENTRQYAASGIEFYQLDGTVQPLPETDFIFSRDFLFHLSFEDTSKYFRNVLNSGAKYIMLTTHINDRDFKNSDIKTGTWRWFDLFLPPFDFPKSYSHRVLDGGGDRYMCVWSIKDLRPAMEKFITRYSGS